MENLDVIDRAKQRPQREQNAIDRKKIAQSTLPVSSKMMPPATKKKLAIYAGLSNGEVDPLTGEPIIPPSIIIPATFVIYDRFEEDLTKRNKLIKYSTRNETVLKDGKYETQEVIEDIIMEGGQKTVVIEDDILLYICMELNPLNASNKWRDQSKPAAFKRIDTEVKSLEVKSAEGTLAWEAESEIREMDFEKLSEIAAGLGFPLTNGLNVNGQPKRRQIGELRYDVISFAKNNPRGYYLQLGSPEAVIKLNVIDGMSNGAIEYDIESRGYYFPDEKKPFFTAGVGEDPVNDLVKWFSSKDKDASDAYYELKDALKYWEKN